MKTLVKRIKLDILLYDVTCEICGIKKEERVYECKECEYKFQEFLIPFKEYKFHEALKHPICSNCESSVHSTAIDSKDELLEDLAPEDHQGFDSQLGGYVSEASSITSSSSQQQPTPLLQALERRRSQ